jgi:hypothetical protein
MIAHATSRAIGNIFSQIARAFSNRNEYNKWALSA